MFHFIDDSLFMDVMNLLGDGWMIKATSLLVNSPLSALDIRTAYAVAKKFDAGDFEYVDTGVKVYVS